MFANVGQRAVRTVARQTFEHLLNLDLKFHLSRQTGGLTRAIDRGTKYVHPPPIFYCYGRAYLAPNAGVLRSSCRLYCSESFLQPLKYHSCVAYWYVGVLSFEAYWLTWYCVDVQVWLGLCGYHTRDHGRIYLVYRSYYCMAVCWSCLSTFILTTSPYHIRTQFRRQANSADNKAATVAVDSLLNYEAVKVRMRHFHVLTNHHNACRISTMSGTKLIDTIRTCVRTRRRLSR